MKTSMGTRLISARRAPLVAVVSLLLVASVGSIAPQAHADNVGDLQARARQIAEQLNDLQRQEGSLAEAFDGLQIKSSQVASQITSTRVLVAHANATIEQRRLELARYSMSAYVSGGGDDDLSAMLAGKQSTSLRRDGYTAAAVGDQQQLVDDFQAASAVGKDTLASLHRAEAEQADLKAQLVAKQQHAADLTQQAEALQAQVQGKLAVAVAQQQAILAAQAEAAAQAKWNASNGRSTASGNLAGAPVTGGASGSPTTRPGVQPGSTPTTGPGATSGSPTTGPHSPATGTPGTTPPTAPPVTAPPVTAPPVTTPPYIPPAPPSSGGAVAAAAAMSQIGVPYSWAGGNSSGPSYGTGTGAHTKGFDCSGLTLYAWAQAGVYLYHNAQAQYDSIRHVSLSQLQVGDLVFYGDSSTTIGHVAIYVGNGTVVHAPNTGSLVQTGPVYLWGGYFAWTGAGRPS